MTDALKLIGTVVALFAAGFGVYWLKSSRDSGTVDKVFAIAEEMCACDNIGCADWVAEKFQREVAGKEVAASKTGMSSAYGDSMRQIGYMEQCHRYIADGVIFAVERDHKNNIKFIRPQGHHGGDGIPTVDLKSIIEAQPRPQPQP